MNTQETKMIEEVTELLEALQLDIDDDARATDDPEDDIPGMCVTIASDDGEEWAFQSGDNSFTGSCYHYHNWGVGYLYRGSNCQGVATDMVDEVFEGIAQRMA